MSMNLGTYALVSALALGGAVAQYQYSQPAGPPDPDSTGQQQTSPVPTGDSNLPTSGTTGPIDCNMLMSHHQQMRAEIDKLDEQVAARVSQMHDAKSDRAKLEATMGVVETLVNQRKQERDRLMRMEHETLQFLMANEDASTSCPQLSQSLQQGAMSSDTADTTERGGPDDGEIYSDDSGMTTPNTTTAPDNATPNNNNRDNGRKH